MIEQARNRLGQMMRRVGETPADTTTFVQYAVIERARKPLAVLDHIEVQIDMQSSNHLIFA